MFIAKERILVSLNIHPGFIPRPPADALLASPASPRPYPLLQPHAQSALSPPASPPQAAALANAFEKHVSGWPFACTQHPDLFFNWLFCLSLSLCL